MIVKDTEYNRALQQTAASMAIENMYLDKKFLTKMIQIGEGKTTFDEVRREVIKEYAENECRKTDDPTEKE